MKKIYQKPTTILVYVELQKMIADSETIAIGESVTTAAGAESRSNGGSFWDDDEE